MDQMDQRGAFLSLPQITRPDFPPRLPSSLRLFCSVSILGEDDIPIRSVSRQVPHSLTRETESPLVGSLVRSLVSCTDLNGHDINLFVFDDVCARMHGRYRLVFELRQA